EDITTSVDTVENIVYGQVASLSPFFIGEPTVLPVADAGGPYLAQVDCSADLDGSASYHPDGTIVSYDWSFGDDTSGSGVSVSHTYTAVGIYEVTLTVTDDKGAQASDTTMVVVYDPDVGSATGGGWFWSAQGNLKSDFESEGKATFGFVVKYKHEAAAGNLEFQYHVGDINLKSSSITRTGLNIGSLDTESISWVLAPRLNAAGRLAHAMTSYRLLMTDSPQEASQLVIWLEEKNAERQRLTTKVLAKAREQILAQGISPLPVASDKGYPVGIIGLVAGRLSEEFYRPTIVIKTGE
ncbi:unnamed protein product, partial [marine sediment metagenome]